MTKNERLFKKEYAKELLNVAEQDYATAKVLHQQIDQVRAENIIFHYQQAVEKSLKAVLCHLEKPVPFTHDLDVIVVLLRPESTPPFADSLSDLTPFATIRRYEEGNDIISATEVDDCESVCLEIINWAKKEIQ